MYFRRLQVGSMLSDESTASPRTKGYVVGGVEVDRGAVPAVFAYLEILGREPAHRIAVAVRHQHLELGQVGMSISLW